MDASSNTNTDADADADAGGASDGAADVGAPFQSNEGLETIPSRGVTLGFDLVKPTGTPTRIVVLLPGSNGLLQLSAFGFGKGSQNFVVRTRQTYVQAGFVVAIPDAPSDHPQGLDDFRATGDHATDMGTLIAWLRSKWPGIPVWMIGTSRGTISVANAAARLGGAPSGPDGIVLTSTVTAIPQGATDRESVTASVTTSNIHVPVALVHHRDDACKASPLDGAQKLASDRGWPFHIVTGGMADGAVCGPLHYHGFEGTEGQVAAPLVIPFVDGTK
jgi:hypothetical protein